MKVKFTYILLFFTVFAFSQEKEKSKDKYLPKGNEAFAEKNYTAAEADYRISQSKTPANANAAYNLGNAIYRQGQSGESMYAYLKAIENAQDKTQKHKAYHNLGNALMKEKDYQNAVQAYKNALRNNPYDDETRYNFALAKEMLEKNPPPEPPKDDKKDDKDKKKDDKSQQPKDKGDDKDKGDKGDQKDKGDKGDEDKKNDKDKGDQKDKGEGKDKEDKGGAGDEQEQDAPNPDKQRMKNLLDAMNNEEKKIQDKINAKKVKVQPKQQEKDW